MNFLTKNQKNMGLWLEVVKIYYLCTANDAQVAKW